MYSPSSGEGGRPKQSRIVIDVDSLQRQGARNKGLRRLGRGGRILSVAGLIVVAALLVAGIGGYLWWQSYKKSPAYSLALLIDAARRDDSQAVEQLVDTDSVAQSLAPQVIDKALASVGGRGTLPAPRRQIEAVLPQLMPYARDQIRAEIAHGVKEATAERGGDMPFFLLALAVPRLLEGVKEEGDSATVVFKVGERPVELSMRRGDERWKVVGIKDEQLAANIAARVVGSLPSQPGPGRR
ncbi:MAG: DUF2939 domain-containing protein [Pyrinomonadaceae bacterium]